MPHPRIIALFSFLIALAAIGHSREGHAQIKQPGAHARYSWDIEPHGVIFWDAPGWYDEGLGVGVRAGIPLFHNGPIPNINNDMTISFGADVAFFSEPCHHLRGDLVDFDDDCSMSLFWFPVVAQWNFYVTRSITAFGEVGFALSYARADYPACGGANNPFCDRTVTDLDVANFILTPGAKFWVSQSSAFIVRIGYPYITLGATFLL